mmetsp:Transcript_106068/g.299900  ORF Transcript_106068/g.299900 Transcript_106068/m.299900 type:complete len:209 (+) Transcript_106068:620-1246(+)
MTTRASRHGSQPWRAATRTAHWPATSTPTLTTCRPRSVAARRTARTRPSGTPSTAWTPRAGRPPRAGSCRCQRAARLPWSRCCSTRTRRPRRRARKLPGSCSATGPRSPSSASGAAAGPASRPWGRLCRTPAPRHLGTASWLRQWTRPCAQPYSTCWLEEGPRFSLRTSAPRLGSGGGTWRPAWAISGTAWACRAICPSPRRGSCGHT